MNLSWLSMFYRANEGLFWSQWCWRSTATVANLQTGEVAKCCDQNSLTLFWSRLLIICHPDHISPTTLLMLWYSTYPHPTSLASTITRCCVSLSLKQDNANICHTLGSFLLRLQSNAPRLRHGQRAEPKQPCRAHAMFAMFTTRRRTLNSLFQWGYIHIHLRAHTQWMPQPWRSR